jgi:hypothetical protein
LVFIHPAGPARGLVAARPGASLALLVPLGDPVGRAQRAVVLGVLLALLRILALLRLAPEKEERKDAEVSARLA